MIYSKYILQKKHGIWHVAFKIKSKKFKNVKKLKYFKTDWSITKTIYVGTQQTFNISRKIQTFIKKTLIKLHF